MGVYFNIELGHKVTIVDNSYYSKISKIEIKKKYLLGYYTQETKRTTE